VWKWEDEKNLLKLSHPLGEGNMAGIYMPTTSQTLAEQRPATLPPSTPATAMASHPGLAPEVAAQNLENMRGVAWSLAGQARHRQRDTSIERQPDDTPQRPFRVGTGVPGPRWLPVDGRRVRVRRVLYRVFGSLTDNS
jgi:hypothetical protein